APPRPRRGALRPAGGAGRRGRARAACRPWRWTPGRPPPLWSSTSAPATPRWALRGTSSRSSWCRPASRTPRRRAARCTSATRRRPRRRSTTTTSVRDREDSPSYLLSYPVSKGLIDNWDDMERFLQQDGPCSATCAAWQDHDFLLTEPPFNTPENRELTAEIIRSM
ncbi:unnamed protein product, partial [Prorocentrum cordatum]